MENTPFISAKCCTYGRVDMLEEALHSFLQQDYPNDKRELVILNDYPLQKLKFEHPLVRIINVDDTFEKLGNKEYIATMLCRGNIICQWDDDDVALPNHLKNVAKYFVEGSNILHWTKGVYYNVNAITAITSVGNSGIVFSKDAWRRVGGHPDENAGYDMTFVNKLHALDRKKIITAVPPDDEVSWFYMWGGRGYHCSGQGDDVEGKPNIIMRHSEHIEYLRKQGKIPIGEIVLNPNWKYDYVKMLKEFVNK